MYEYFLFLLNTIVNKQVHSNGIFRVLIIFVLLKNTYAKLKSYTVF